MKSLILAFKSVLFRRKQYLSLVLVCLFGCGISLFCMYLVDGMLDALEYKAKIYYGGDLQFLGESKNLVQKRPDKTIQVLKEVFPEDCVIAKRFDFDAASSSFYFEGTGVRQRVIKGIDFKNELQLFSNWNFIAGNADDIYGTNGILISEPIAKMLGVQVGDELTFMFKNYRGQIDTRYIIVKGIFRDSSLFGMYTSYMDINFLLKAYGYSTKWCNRICVFFPNGSPSESEILNYQSELEQKFKMYPLTDDKQKFYDDTLKLKQPLYALIKLSANLQDVQILIDAMTFIATFIIVMLIIIIVAGVSSTFRVIVMKRINEIGIYKAIGMKRHKIMAMMLYETVLLVVLGCILGFLLSLGLTSWASHINLSFIPAFDIFLTNGVLKAKISYEYFAIISLAITVTTTIAVLFSIRKAVRIFPCEALAITE